MVLELSELISGVAVEVDVSVLGGDDSSDEAQAQEPK
jgi:hypothetical protein